MRLLEYTKRLLQDKDIKIIILLFLTWKLVLITVTLLSVVFLPLRSNDLLGGGFDKYSSAPWFFGWANFDGEHYLSIAQIGYRDLEQAFFPIYPILINFFSKLFGGSIETFVLSGLLISNIAFLLSLIILWKLILFDYPKKIAFLTILTVILFPTSFFFGALYSESLFLLLTTVSFYLLRTNHFLLASLSGVFSSGTRIFGVFLAPAYLLEVWQNGLNIKKVFWIFFIPGGLLIYMIYQWLTVGDPIAFYHLQKIVGPQHESGITLLPQVYYRYVKILLTTSFSNPIYQTVILELFVGIVFFLLPIFGYFKKMRFSYVFYALAGFLLPTIQGSFSSTPRYVIVLFPSFIALALFISNLRLSLRILILVLSGIWLIFEAALFFRGYWVG